MSMREALFGDYPIPDDTQRVAHAAFPKGNLYIQLRDRFGMVYSNQRFAHLFASEGKPALAPARLALVLILQFSVHLTETVRRVTRRAISAAGGIDTKGGQWVTRPT